MPAAPGALTQEGIRLITVAGQSDAQFSLQGARSPVPTTTSCSRRRVDPGRWQLVPALGIRAAGRSAATAGSPDRPAAAAGTAGRPAVSAGAADRSAVAAGAADRSAAAAGGNAPNRRPTWPTAAPRWACSGTACTTAPVIPPPAPAPAVTPWPGCTFAARSLDSHDRNRQVQVDGQISSVKSAPDAASRWVAPANCRPVRCSAMKPRAMTAARR
jgi:autotransporter family porin